MTSSLAKLRRLRTPWITHYKYTDFWNNEYVIRAWCNGMYRHYSVPPLGLFRGGWINDRHTKIHLARSTHVGASDPTPGATSPLPRMHSSVLRSRILRYGPQMIARGRCLGWVFATSLCWRSAASTVGRLPKHLVGQQLPVSNFRYSHRSRNGWICIGCWTKS